MAQMSRKRNDSLLNFVIFSLVLGVDVLATNPTVPYRLTLANGKEAGVEKKIGGDLKDADDEDRWWLKKIWFIFTPKSGEDEPILTSIFFKGVGSTTN